MNIKKHCIKTINKSLQAAKQQFNKAKLNSINHREDHLRQQAEEYKLIGNKQLARYLRNLITIEQQKEVHQNIS